jgi:hypothetical protein
MKQLVFIICLLALLSSCSNYNFIRTGLDNTQFAPQPANCDVIVLTSLPTDRVYTEIGICKGTVPGGGMVSDRTHAAIKQLKRCACANGGNAILLNNTDEGGYFTEFGYSQQVAKASGRVFYIHPK